MALDTFLAGRYSTTFNAVDTGISEGGQEIQKQTFVEMISESDAYGQTPIDGIWRGGECIVDINSLACKAGSLTPFWPWGGNTTAGAMGTLLNPTAGGTLTPIGYLMSNNAKAFVMTAVAATPAAIAGAPGGPASITATLAILRENTPAKLIFNSKLKKVPINLRLFPADVGSSVIKFFAVA